MDERRHGNQHDRRHANRHVLDIPDPITHPWRYRWVALRWRAGLLVSTHPVALALVIALAVCAYPLYAVLDQQGTLRDNQAALQRYADDNRAAIDRLRRLTLRVTKIEHPTPAELRAAIAHALVNCGHNPRCRVLFGRLVKQARRELLRQHQRAIRRAEQGLPPASSGGASGGASPPVEHHRTGRAPSAPPRSPDGGRPTTPAPVPAPTPTPPAPRPPNLQLPPTPVHVPSICTPLVGVNCP